MYIAARRLFDGRSPELVPDPLVHIVDGRIVSITDAATAPPGEEMVDLGDVTLIPGLIDIHQHLAFDASADPVAQIQADDDATLLLRMRLTAQRALAVGITTIRDLGDRNYLSLVLRDWYRDGGEVGPRILASGPPLTVTNGHCWFLGGVADGVEGVHAAVRERVDARRRRDQDHGDGRQHDADGWSARVAIRRGRTHGGGEEAHAHGRKLAVHAHGSQGIIDALAAGADSIEHCTFFNAEGVDELPDVLDQLARSGVAISVTGAVLPGTQPAFLPIAKRFDAMIANMQTLFRAGARMVMSSDRGYYANQAPRRVAPRRVRRVHAHRHDTVASARVGHVGRGGGMRD